MEPDQVPSFLKLKQHQRKILQCAAVSSIFLTAVSTSSNQQYDSQCVQYYIKPVKW